MIFSSLVFVLQTQVVSHLYGRGEFEAFLLVALTSKRVGLEEYVLIIQPPYIVFLFDHVKAYGEYAPYCVICVFQFQESMLAVYVFHF